MSAVLVVLFWVSALGVAYTYVLYPLVLRLMSALVGVSPRSVEPLRDDDALPNVAVLVSALNEEGNIGPRIENLLTQDYPASKLRMLVGSDGSTDGTADVVRSFGDERVQLFDSPQNLGKATMLNELVDRVEDADLLIFSDANTQFDRGAVRQLASHFCDSEVGLVCGELTIVHGSDRTDESAYWRLERWMKEHEGRIGGLLGANGAIYAMRTSLYSPLDPTTLTDDFVIAMNVAMKGFRVRYDDRAKAFERGSAHQATEFTRRVRIGLGNYRVLFGNPEYLLQGPPMLSFTYFSHKVLRWLTPHLLLLAFLSSLVLAPVDPFFRVLLAVQIAVYATALLVWCLDGWKRAARPLRLLALLCGLNVALALAFVKFISGSRERTWRPAVRSDVTGPDR